MGSNIYSDTWSFYIIFIRELISPAHSHLLGAEDDTGHEHQETSLIIGADLEAERRGCTL